jgi:hypothetical protein
MRDGRAVTLTCGVVVVELRGFEPDPLHAMPSAPVHDALCSPLGTTSVLLREVAGKALWCDARLGVESLLTTC